MPVAPGFFFALFFTVNKHSFYFVTFRLLLLLGFTCYGCFPLLFHCSCYLNYMQLRGVTFYR